MQNNTLKAESDAAYAAGVGDSYIQGGIKRTVLQKAAVHGGLVADLNLVEVPSGTSAAPHQR